ncbi:MAG: rod shape-determining protein MreC [Bacteroidales bacterium]|nr:rod shape-determining protein MreC [Bacteroidales bacterium]
MRSLLSFFLKYNNILIFILLESAAIYLIYNNSGYHNIRLSNAAAALEGSLLKRIEGATGYFSLRQTNRDLIRENLELRRLAGINGHERDPHAGTYNEPSDSSAYNIISAVVVNQTINRQKNFLTLDRGKADGIEPGMAVVGPDGVVGVVTGASRNYSVVISLLNIDFRLSARFSNSGYFGSLAWNGSSPGRAVLNDIPHHVSVQQGDTVETSGYSSIFPPGIMIGTVESFDSSRGDFLNIEIRLSTSFGSLYNVYIIDNRFRDERRTLETEYGEEGGPL